MITFSSPMRRALFTAGALLVATFLAGCDNAQSGDAPHVSSSAVTDSSAAAKTAGSSAPAATSAIDAASPANAGGWPRTLQTPQGPLTLQQPPRRIVSTSVTLTGTLLAINAPLVGSGATGRNSSVADENGFFNQWSAVARQRGLQPLYVTEPNAEAIAAAAPDLIVIAATGGDSAAKVYDQLATIAPVLVIDYGNKSWQQLAQQLGQITGHEDDARRVIAGYQQRLAEVKRSITLPPQPVSALVYYEDGRGMNLWTADSAQGRLLTELGFTLALPPSDLHAGTSMGKRNDIIQLSGENMAAGVTGKTLLLFSSNSQTVQKVLGNPFLAHLEPVSAQRVYSLGEDTFRLDYYSASNALDAIEEHFKSR